MRERSMCAWHGATLAFIWSQVALSLNSNIHNMSLWLLPVPLCSPANRKVKFACRFVRLSEYIRAFVMLSTVRLDHRASTCENQDSKLKDALQRWGEVQSRVIILRGFVVTEAWAIVSVKKNKKKTINCSRCKLSHTCLKHQLLVELVQ